MGSLVSLVGLLVAVIAAEPGPIVPEPGEAPVPTPPIEVPPPDVPSDPPPSEPPPPAAPITDAREPSSPDGPLGIDLEWRAAAGCPAPDRVVAAMSALLGRKVELDPTAAVVVRADVVADGGGWRIDLELDGPGGSERRRLNADSCDLLSEAAALVIATNIDPTHVAAVLERPPSDAKPANDTRRRAPSDRTSASRSGPRRIGVALVVRGGPVLGATPKITGWLQGGLDVSIGRAIVGAHAGHGFARRADGDATLRASMTAGGLRGCFAPTQGRLAVPLCALFEVGAVTARAEGPTTRTARGLWVGAGGGAAIEWAPHPRVALVGGVDALVAAVRPQFRALGPAGTSTEYRVAPAVVRATLGIAVRLR